MSRWGWRSMRARSQNVVLVAMTALIASCAAASAPSVSPGSPTPSPTPLKDPDLAAARARWEATGPSTYAYTFDHRGPGGTGWDWRYRVVALEGHTEVAHLDGDELNRDGEAQITIEGLFDAIARGVTGTATLDAEYDPVLGYPVGIARADSMVADAESVDTVTEMRVAPDADPQPAADGLRSALADARAAWRRWEPGVYEYTWTASTPGGTPQGAPSIRVHREDGVTTSTRGEAHASTDGAGIASVEAQFDAIEAALDSGAWVEAVFDRVLGVPLLVAVDPSPAAGDATWTIIRFDDLEATAARDARTVAADTWASNRPKHYSYTWRFRSGDISWTYRVVMDGDVADITASGGAPTGEAADLAPRIDDLLALIEQVQAFGGRVTATYDESLGFPTKVVLPQNEWTRPGTITIRDMEVDLSR